MVLAPDLMLTVFQKLYEEDQSEKENIAGLHLVPFYILPHLNSEWFEKVREKEIRELLQNCPYPVYTLDDETALSVVGDVIKVIGDGEWFLIEKTKQD
jgi:peptidase E